MFILRMHVFMLKKYTYLMSLSLMAVLISSCHSDVGEINPNTVQTEQITIPFGFDEVTGNLVGYVFDQSNNPIANAEVSIYSAQTTTNEYGVFLFSNSNFDPQGTFVRVEKEGYLVGSDLVYPNSDGKGTARIMLIKSVNEPTFDAHEGGVIQIEGGGTITFPPSSLIRANGSIYDGIVKATAYRISPTDPEFGDLMSGGLLGVDKEGRHRVLSTFGLVAVELRGFDNQLLRIKSDKEAELTFPIDDELKSALIDNVPSWNFNLQDGLWYENEITVNDNEEFRVSIGALGFWNFALPNAVSQVCGRLIYSNDLPAANYEVQIINNGLPSRIGITDHDGFFCGKVPMGEDLNFQVLHPTCGQLLKEETIGAFEAVGTIGDIVLDINEDYIVGTVECAGDQIGNSTIIIESNGTTNVFYPNDDGSFEINLDEVLCIGDNSFSLFAYNNDTEESSEKLDLTSELLESIRLDVCQSLCTAKAEFDYEKEDYCINGVYSRVQVKIDNGSGEYVYEWSDGSTGLFFNNPIPGNEICVKVTDMVTECEYEFCDEVKLHQRLNITSMYSSNTECQMNSGYVVVEVEGGKGDLTYSWTGPDGFVSSEAELFDLKPGEYSVQIMDEAGCETIESNVVHDVTKPIQSSIEHYCNQSVITIEEDEGYKPYTFVWDGGNPSGNQLYVSTPGVYRLTITDSNLCTRKTSIVMNQVGLLPTIDPTYECETENAVFSNLEQGYEYYYQAVGSSNRIPLSLVQGKAEVPILEAGYRFELGSENSISSNCYTSELVELPRFEGLEIAAINSVSCESCTDGSIEFNKNIDKDCIDCLPGDVIVLRAGDLSDVTAMNAGQELSKGEYYVVVLDGNNGCYIAHSLVEVE